MTNLVAKPIIKDQYWIVTDGENKIGNVVVTNTGVSLKIHGSSTQYEDTNDLKRQTHIKFQPLKSPSAGTNLPYSEYPTTNKVYNSMLDVRRKLHLYTKTLKSKCYHAAGWFALKQPSATEVVFCPKYIFVQRYAYLGPFKTEDEAKVQINNL